MSNDEHEIDLGRPEADRPPTPDEERDADVAADELGPDELAEVAEHYEEMAERGAHQQGEGRIEP